MRRLRNTAGKLLMWSEKNFVKKIQTGGTAMPFKVIVTRDFDHMSEVAAQIVVKDIQNTITR